MWLDFALLIGDSFRSSMKHFAMSLFQPLVSSRSPVEDQIDMPPNGGIFWKHRFQLACRRPVRLRWERLGLIFQDNSDDGDVTDATTLALNQITSGER